jgi:hypothetical protein
VERILENTKKCGKQKNNFEMYFDYNRFMQVIIIVHRIRSVYVKQPSTKHNHDFA